MALAYVLPLLLSSSLSGTFRSRALLLSTGAGDGLLAAASGFEPGADADPAGLEPGADAGLAGLEPGADAGTGTGSSVLTGPGADVSVSGTEGAGTEGTGTEGTGTEGTGTEGTEVISLSSSSSSSSSTTVFPGIFLRCLLFLVVRQRLPSMITSYFLLLSASEPDGRQVPAGRSVQRGGGHKDRPLKVSV